MFSRRCAERADATRVRPLLFSCALLTASCAVFEAPIETASDDASASFDSGEPLQSSADAEPTPEDAGNPDAASEPATPIPVRPMLAKCGFSTPIGTGVVEVAKLDEISGIAVSRRNPRIVWAIEDSGNGATVHALNDRGALVATFTVSGAAVDYEDIAVGPGPVAGTSYLYIADIGDNNGMRPGITVYRAPEPAVAWDQPFETTPLLSVDPLPMKYPTGTYNAEALMVDPETQDLYLITKDGFQVPNTLYRLAAPHTPAVTRTLEKLIPVYAGAGTDIAVTAADISADGKHIMIRSLRSLNHWTRKPGVSIVETIRDTEPCDAELAPDETKGESVSFASDGYYTISEGASESLHFVAYPLP